MCRFAETAKNKMGDVGRRREGRQTDGIEEDSVSDACIFCIGYRDHSTRDAQGRSGSSDQNSGDLLQLCVFLRCCRVFKN